MKRLIERPDVKSLVKEYETYLPLVRQRFNKERAERIMYDVIDNRCQSCGQKLPAH